MSGLMDALPATIQRRLRAMGHAELPTDRLPTPEEYAAEVREDLRRRRAEVALNIWLRTCPPLHADATLTDFDNPQQREALTEARAWIDSDQLTLVLAGPVGVGKSRLACAIARHVTEDEQRPMFMSATNLLKGFRPDGDEQAATAAAHTGFLVLDDLGVAKGSEWAADTLTDLMEHRINYDLRTVATTNATATAVRDLYGERLMDRLTYRASFATITGPSRRARTERTTP